MRNFYKDWGMPGVAKFMHIAASKGAASLAHQNLESPRNLAYLESCRAIHWPSGTGIVFTRDSGHHASGWWKNPDYERCLHLSLSFVDPETGEPINHEHKLAGQWIDQFFPSVKNLIWTEPPYGPQGKARDVWHYRVFYHSDWRTPLLPRGEVYTKAFTDAGWLSWSDREQQLAEKESERPAFDHQQCKCSSPTVAAPCRYCEHGDYDPDTV